MRKGKPGQKQKDQVAATSQLCVADLATSQLCVADRTSTNAHMQVGQSLAATSQLWFARRADDDSLRMTDRRTHACRSRRVHLHAQGQGRMMSASAIAFVLFCFGRRTPRRRRRLASPREESRATSPAIPHPCKP